MADGLIGSQTFDLKQLFERATYDIDSYQREYAWSSDDVRTLVDDLCDDFGRYQPDGMHRRKPREREPSSWVLSCTTNKRRASASW
jgi:uncharacterized protein with ParB-like and HNH nuclease domain